MASSLPVPDLRNYSEVLVQLMNNQEFPGANKTNTSLLSPLERRLTPLILPRIPFWLETHHLTMLTLAWSAGIVLFSYFAATNIRWMWVVSLMIFLQYVTDHCDGKIGKQRNTGLVRWGYYMDHLLDYFFLGSVIIGYAFILPEKVRYQLLFLLAVFGAFVVSAFLAFSATERLTISHLKLGPTEFRLALIVINTLLILFGKRYMISGLKWVNAGALICLCYVVYKTQKQIWQLDMQARGNSENRDVAKSYESQTEVYSFSVGEKARSIDPSNTLPVS